jgi:conjugative transfer signal peptidase TraF
MLLGILALAFTTLMSPAYKLVYNASASVPEGWYVIHPARSWPVGTLVYVWLPLSARQLASQRNYLPASVPALKFVVAGPGDRVCERDGLVTVNEIIVANARSRDGLGRPLTPWSGCQTLTTGQLFVVNTRSAASFDSRYFGPITETDVIAVACPVWTR